ncbi:Protein STRUBBELIG-RECEPTOR FAMILY 3 [Forsythia ovata]|uniref:Protein STRUBBELIG-RECEPTOR FAMILY 3 n=1 Tax=Forsythia ovata TaxID=205694 RepID=A0ABD1RZF0_9LAMI
MGGNRSAVNCLNFEILLGFILVFVIWVSEGYTNPSDVAAINSLHVALGSPSLPGWVASGGDPCGGEVWQGVECQDTTISVIKLTGANLGGELGDNLGAFSSIRSIELSNNLIGGSIPSNLPATLLSFFLADNKFTGSIPSSISSLSQLSAMSLNKNELTGDIPDAFEGLTLLVNLDLSSNNLSGQLPPSLGNLSSVTTLHLQNNQLSGTLNVLQDLPLRDLNIENNLFSGPVPAKLLSIPNFMKDGNPFNTTVGVNTTVAPVPQPASPGTRPPAPPFFPTSQQTPPTSGRSPRKQADGPSATEEQNSKRSKKSSSTKRVVWISIAAVLSFIILVLVILLFLPRCLRERREPYRTPKRREIAPYMGTRENHRDGGSLIQPSHDKEKGKCIVMCF